LALEALPHPLVIYTESQSPTCLGVPCCSAPGPAPAERAPHLCLQAITSRAALLSGYHVLAEEAHKCHAAETEVCPWAQGFKTGSGDLWHSTSRWVLRQAFVCVFLCVHVCVESTSQLPASSIHHVSVAGFLHGWPVTFQPPSCTTTPHGCTSPMSVPGHTVSAQRGRRGLARHSK
jgi:hypothetical protein